MEYSITTEGFRLAYDRVGYGRPVVLLHGWPGDRTDYDQLVPQLQGHADVVVPDLRGFGQSDTHADADPERFYSAPGQARGIIALMDELKIKDVVLGGYDVGSLVAQTVASMRPDLVRALVVSPPLPGAGYHVRLKDAEGAECEWHSRIIRRYQRRTERVDAALLGTYLSGINTRRLWGALAPLLRGASLSKDAVSRLIGRLRDEFTAWSVRDLAAEEVCYLFLDGWYPRVRIGKKRARVPVLVVLGVCAAGRRIVLDMRLASQESEAAWCELLQSLVARHLGTPSLAVIDGNPGLQAALRRQWPEIAIQRCTNHKLRNLLAKASAHLREEVAGDYRRMVYADSREAVAQARASFLRKWRLRCKAVVSSFEEAGD